MLPRFSVAGSCILQVNGAAITCSPTAKRRLRRSGIRSASSKLVFICPVAWPLGGRSWSAPTAERISDQCDWKGQGWTIASLSLLLICSTALTNFGSPALSFFTLLLRSEPMAAWRLLEFDRDTSRLDEPLVNQGWLGPSALQLDHGQVRRCKN